MKAFFGLKEDKRHPLSKGNHIIALLAGKKLFPVDEFIMEEFSALFA